MSGKLLTIVIPSYNQAKYIERTLQSVLSQKAEDVEVFVIDGGSSDGAVEIIKAYADKLDYWVSEPDRGQSHAFNKGFERANGCYLTWVNSDDILLPGAIDAFRRFVSSRSYPSWVAANSLWIDAKDRLILATYNSGWSELAARYGALSVTGPASFFLKSLLEEAGWMDESYHYSMDTELWYRFFDKGAHYAVLDHFVWALRLHAEAKVSGKDFTADQKAIESIAGETKRTFEKYGLRRPNMFLKLCLMAARLKRAAKIRTLIYSLLVRGRRV